MLALALALLLPSAFAQQCRKECKAMLNDLPALGECRQYRMQLPRPKVGKACTDGFLALGLMSCEAICTGLEPLPDKVPAANDFCRKFMKEYPKPTVHKACKHGASRGFDLAAEAAREKFSLNGGEDGGPPAQDGELRAEPVRQAAAKEAPKQEAPKPPAPPLPEDARRLLASLPVTVDEEEVYLKIFEGQDATEEILAFCSDWMSDSVDGCIKQLTPHILKKIAATLAA
mmetsp:Transcript_31225/g.105057  ORF Transcript_31225/g.105057 Transcript_31225/m.105057 type:complete len:230 (-) Transcript_31225:238-927(-)